MNEDYLWDKSGKPDPQIQELEEILGTLRYQPRPFEVPRDVPAPRRRSYFPLLAIAATLLVALLAGGIWLRVRTRNKPQPQYVRLPTPPVEEKPIATEEPEKTPVAPKQSLAVNRGPRKRSSSSALDKREREEALAAKQQLMLALRVASEKLNLVHKRTHSTSPANQIKNQHRVG